MDADPTGGRSAAALAETTRLQMAASDPRASVWVSANAGTGKTHVLTQRVLRLLLAGTAPERILCLTYTKAAAAEMSKRVFDTLSGFVGMDEDGLGTALYDLLGMTASAAERARARTLFTAAIETPGGFKVQTIHAFCEQLLQRFPLEAGVAPGFEILDEHTSRMLSREAIDGMLTEATADREGVLGQALTTAIRYAADDQFDAVLREGIARRKLLEALVRRPDGGDPFATARTLLARALGVRAAVDRAGLDAEMAAILDTSALKRLAAALAEGTKTDAVSAQHIASAAAAGGRQRVDKLAAYFLTGEGVPRKRLMTIGVRDAHTDLDAMATTAQARFVALRDELIGLDVVDATVALYRLSDAVLGRYQQAKAARAALDFDDLIVKTGHLLTQPDGAAWVLYKLDGGLDHILVDEAQDTSPAQWDVIEAIANEFLADRGAGSRVGARTVFAVGDEKQSIYSFQGAAPEMFARKGRHFENLASNSAMPWQTTALTLSFRTVEPILKAVDCVFSNADATPGLMTDAAHPIRHAVKRLGQAGLVELWPTEKSEAVTETGAWDPLDEATPSSPVTRLATKIAGTIRGWLDTAEQLPSQGRAIRAGDILVLVRKRTPFAPAIVSALKAAGVRVAGADRIALADQIGVQDLLALGDFLTLPEDDLALACVLKSPLFGLDDDGLLELCPARKGTLWKALLDAGGANERFAQAAGTLKRWRTEADFLPPFEFYSAVLDHDGGRACMINRLGPDCADGIDAFLNLALTYDDQAPPSLTGFLASVRDTARTIKRDMDQGRDEVRVLTVHGAKGLEAPIVFLPDTCTTKSGRSAGQLLALTGFDLPSGMPDLEVWPVKGASGLAAVADAKAGVAAREAQELNRLLYVALTRPRDRLYIAGFQTRDSLPANCWYEVVRRTLEAQLTAIEQADGTTIWRLAAGQTAKPDSRGSELAGVAVPARRPAWMTAPAPREVQPQILVAPSRLAPYDFDADGEPVARPAAPGGAFSSAGPVHGAPQAGGFDRFLRGALTHALLQHLPTLPRETWSQAAKGYLDRRGADLPPTVRVGIARETLALLADPTFASLFGPGSVAEVPIVAELPNRKKGGPPLRLTGQIDRLVDTGREILIVDYKTNRPAPRILGDVPPAHLAQLAAYRLALAVIFPARTLRAALLWTQIPLLMEIPASALDQAERVLWASGTANLDVVGLRS